MDRSTLTTRTRLAQGGCMLGVAALVGAVWWARVPAQVEQPPATPELPEQTSTSPDAGAAQARVDLVAIGARLAKIDNRPREPEIVPIEVDPEPTMPTSTIAFHGVATIGSRKLALVNVAGAQRFVGVGQAIDGSTVQDVTDEELILSGDRRIPRSERSGAAVTKTTGSASTASVPMGVNPMGVATRRPRGGFAVPPHIEAAETNAWRMLRNQVESDPQYQAFDASLRDETATKLLENQRETLRARGIIPTRSEKRESEGRP